MTSKSKPVVAPAKTSKRLRDGTAVIPRTPANENKRKRAKQRTLGSARQKTTMEDYVSRFKDPAGDGQDTEEESAAIGVDSHCVKPVVDSSSNVVRDFLRRTDRAARV